MLNIALNIGLNIALQIATSPTRVADRIFWGDDNMTVLTSLALGEHTDADAEQDVCVALCVTGLDGKDMVLGCDGIVELPFFDGLEF